MKAVNTRFMQGYKGCEVFDELTHYYDMATICNHEIDFSEAIYSERFIEAVNRGMKPIIDSVTPSFLPKKDGEYHHFVYNDECYVMYFEEVEE